MTNDKQIFLENTGCAELSLLKRCWSDLGEEDFHRLMLMLQSFCLVFPLPKRAEKDDTQTPCAQVKPDQQEEPEKSPSLPPLNQMYLIPSKLQSETFNQDLTKNFNLSFQFDFGGFLPEEVYHRLLCLMLKKLPKMSGKHKDLFTTNFFKIYGVENCNWVVQMVSSKLCVWVKHEERYISIALLFPCIMSFLFPLVLFRHPPTSTLSTWTTCKRYAMKTEAVCRV